MSPPLREALKKRANLRQFLIIFDKRNLENMVTLANLNKNIPISYFFHGNFTQKLKNAWLSFKFFQKIKNIEH